MNSIRGILVTFRSGVIAGLRDFFAPLLLPPENPALIPEARASSDSIVTLHTDAPISSLKISDDLLNRAGFAKKIAIGIKSAPVQHGFVMSIEGKWGYGKTSLLNLIEREFDNWPEVDKPIVIPFNPWMVGNAETLVQSFLVQMAATIGKTDSALAGKRAANELIGYSTLFTLLRFVPGAEPWASIAHDVVRSTGESTKRIAELKELDLEKHKLSVISALQDFRKRIVVFIDDIDRLPPDEVFQMVRLIKSVGDFPGIVYVLCFDPNYVNHALEKFGLGEGTDYLDKVVQARLSLPIIDSEDLLNILNKEFDNLPQEATIERFPRQKERSSETYHYGLKTILETPRDIKRLFNRLRFTEPGCRGEVNIADLVALEAIAIKANPVYQHIRQQPVAYTGREIGMAFEIESADKRAKKYVEDRKTVLQMAPPHLQRAISSLLNTLFPLTSESEWNHRLDDANALGLISSPDRLAIALAAGLPRNEASLSMCQDFILHPEQRPRIIDDFKISKKLNRFTGNLLDLLKQHKVVDTQDFAMHLAMLLDTEAGQNVENARNGYFESPFSRKIWWCLEAALEILDSQLRFKLLQNIIESENTFSIATEVISFLHAQQGTFSSNRAAPESNWWASKYQLEALTDTWAVRVCDAIKDRSIFNKTLLGTTLWRLKDLRQALMADTFESTTIDDTSLDKLVLAYGHKGSDSTGGDFAEFKKHDLDCLGGDSPLKTRARERLEDSKVQGRLRHAYNALISGNKIYLDSGKMATRY